MLILNSEQIKDSVTILDVLESVEEAFLLQETGNCLMPDRMHIENNGNTLLLMPAFSGNYFSTKLVSVYPGNIKKGEPFIYGAVLLNDGSSGKPLALLDGSMLTGLRTGAVGGLGVAYTSPKEASVLGVIGAGFQGFHQVLFACTVRNIKTVHLFDPFNKSIEKFISSLQKYLPHVVFKISDSASQLISNSEIIITSTNSQTPVVPDNPEILDGKHFIGIGSFKPKMREFPDSLFSLLDEVVIDTNLASKESGDLRIPLMNKLINKNQLYRLGQLISGEKEIDPKKRPYLNRLAWLFSTCWLLKQFIKRQKKKDLEQKLTFKRLQLP